MAVNKVAWFILVNDLGKGQKTLVALILCIVNAKGGAWVMTISIVRQTKTAMRFFARSFAFELPCIGQPRVLVVHGSFKTYQRKTSKVNYLAMNIVAAFWRIVVKVIIMIPPHVVKWCVEDRRKIGQVPWGQITD